MPSQPLLYIAGRSDLIVLHLYTQVSLHFKVTGLPMINPFVYILSVTLSYLLSGVLPTSAAADMGILSFLWVLTITTVTYSESAQATGAGV